MESAFDMDFLSRDGKAGQRNHHQDRDAPCLPDPSSRSRNTQSDHEHFAAIDLVVGDEARDEPKAKSTQP